MTLYQKVQAAIADMIKSHRLHPGAALPSEKELEMTYGVSRITIRRALEELEKSGQVVRSKGRSARVAQPFQAHARTRLEDDFMTMLDLVRGTVPEIVGFEWQLPDDELYALLELEAREPVLRVDRVRKSSGRPILHSVAYVPAFVGVKMDKDELSSATMIEVLSRSGMIPFHVEQFMSAVPCSEAIAAHLQIDVGVPLFQIDRIVRDDSYRIIQILTISFRGDGFVFHLLAKYSENSEDVVVASAPLMNKSPGLHGSAQRR